MGTLEGKVALVTGGAQGIGYGVTRKLIEEGASVVFVDIDDVAARKVEAELGERASAFVGDLLDPKVPDQAVAAAVDHFGGIDIVVNNAGFYWNALVDKMSDEQWQTMLDIHMTAPFRILRAAGPHFIAAAKRDAEAGVECMRKVVNVSSLAASFGLIGAANYGAAKAGLIGLTKTLAKEWGRHKINVNAVSFGMISTRFGLPQGPQNRVRVGDKELQLGLSDKAMRAQGRREPEALRTFTDEEIYATRPVAGVPLGRVGHITEAADTVYYLCSPLSNYVTGQVIAASGGVDGGMF